MARAKQSANAKRSSVTQTRQTTTSVPVDALLVAPGINDNSQGILRLPDDVLADISWEFAKIFLDVIDPPDFPNSWNYPAACGWITISHICHRWREVALSTARLWTTIQLTSNFDRVAAMLDRSRQAPLTVFECTSAFDNDLQASKQLVLKEIYRVQHIKLVLDHQTLDFLAQLRVERALLLKTLDFTCNDEDADGPLDLDKCQSAFASWSLPSLTQLAFHEREGRLTHGTERMPEISLVQPFLRATMTHLGIDALKTPISVDTCLDLLRTLPLLQKLRLGNVLALPPGIPQNTGLPSTTRTVHLPHLRHIDIQRTDIWKDWDYDYDSEARFDSGVAAADLLRHLVIPISPSVYFSAGHQDLSEDHLRFIFSSLCDTATITARQSADAQPTIPFAHCTVNLSQDGLNFVVQLNCTPQPLSNGHPYGPSQEDRSRTLHIVVRPRYLNGLDSIRTFLDFGFPLSDVLTLHWHGASDTVDCGYWPAILRAMPALREIQVNGSARSLIRAMGEASHSPGTTSSIKDEPPIDVLPNLARIQVERVFWGPHDSNDTRSKVITQDWWRREPFVDQLLRTFSTRRTRLEELIVKAPIKFKETDTEKLESNGVAETVTVVH